MRAAALTCAVYAAAVLLAALTPHCARAALGEPEASASTDAQYLKGSVKSAERGVYRVHDVRLPSGTLLREFAVAGGTVFAVSWSGPVIPNLRQALGQYFDAFAAGSKAEHAGHTRFQMTADDLVVQSHGHMRAFTGVAYLPHSLPAGVDPSELH